MASIQPQPVAKTDVLKVLCVARVGTPAANPAGQLMSAREAVLRSFGGNARFEALAMFGPAGPEAADAIRARVARGDVDLVVATSAARLGRDETTVTALAEACSAHGARLVSLDGLIDTGRAAVAA